MEEQTIEIKNLSYWYKGFEDRPPVLNNLSLNIRQGEKVLLIGPSGCGKSTLLLCLIGIIPHSIGGKIEGELSVMGMDVLKTSVPKMGKIVQLVFQNPDEQLSSLWVEDEIAFGLENIKLPAEEVLHRVDETLKFVGLHGFNERVVYDLSGGEKQRLAIASALALQPKVLLLDAPTSNVDPIGRTEIISVINKIHEQRKDLTVVMVEHIPDDVIQIVDRVVVMNQYGQITKSYSVEEAMEDGIYLRDELGLWIPEVSEIALELKSRGKNIGKIPITIDEAIKTLSKLKWIQTPIKRHEFIKRPGNPVIKVENLSFTYPTGTQALRDISFEVCEGEFVAMVGQNGSGKTTLALNLIGILKPTKGEVIIGGKSAKELRPSELAKIITYIFQYPEHQFIEQTIYDEMAFGPRIRGYAERDVEELAINALNEIGMDDPKYRNRHPYNLSLGEKRRLSVAVMMILNPKVVVLDEPTYGQDRTFCDELMNYMVKLNKSGTTIFFITHSMRTVAEYADRVLCLDRGKLVYSGNLKEFFSNSGLLHQCMLSSPPVTELSLKMFAEPILNIKEFCDRFI